MRVRDFCKRGEESGIEDELVYRQKIQGSKSQDGNAEDGHLKCVSNVYRYVGSSCLDLDGACGCYPGSSRAKWGMAG